LKIPLGRAEEMKTRHGAAFVEEADKGVTVAVNAERGLPVKTVNLEHLRRIMSVRLEELFQLIEQELSQAGLLDYLRAGVFICGGGARMPGIQKLAQDIFNLPASLGRTHSISGLKSALDQPEFATAIGLVKYGSFQHKKRANGSFITRRFKETVNGLLGRS
jgi:cell division protein FtsA